MGEGAISLEVNVALNSTESGGVLIWATCYPIRQGVIRRNYPTGVINEEGVRLAGRGRGDERTSWWWRAWMEWTEW